MGFMERVAAECERCLAIARKNYPGIDLPFPKISFDLKGTSAGQAHWGKWEIRLNFQLMKENPERIIGQTVGHEVAHLVDFRVNPGTKVGRWGRKRELHGWTWARIMWEFGLAAERCHSMNTANSRRGSKQETKDPLEDLDLM